MRAESAERLALAGPAAPRPPANRRERPASQSAPARARRGQAIARRNAEAAAWEREHPAEATDEAEYGQTILPALAARCRSRG